MFKNIYIFIINLNHSIDIYLNLLIYYSNINKHLLCIMHMQAKIVVTKKKLDFSQILSY